jgi:citrate lyase gamma subunit
MSDVVTEETIDALLSENPALNRIPVRIDKGTQKGSVIDIIRMITGQSSNHAGQTLKRLGHNMKARCSQLKINNKGNLTQVASASVLLEIIAALSGANAKSLQYNMIQQGHKLKRKFSELVSNGNVDISQGSTTLKLQLSSATIEHEGKHIQKWDYLDHVSPTTEQAMQLIEHLFPIEFIYSGNQSTGGIVYFIRIRNTSLVKIGYTTQPIEQRLSQLQVAQPVQLLIDFTYSTNDYRRIEQSLHKLLQHVHIRGEWFCLNQNISYLDILTCLKLS